MRESRSSRSPSSFWSRSTWTRALAGKQWQSPLTAASMPYSVLMYTIQLFWRFHQFFCCMSMNSRSCSRESCDRISRWGLLRAIACLPVPTRPLTLYGSSGYSVGRRVEIEASTVKVDGRLEVLPVAEAVGHFLDGLDLGVEALTDRVGDPVGEERHDVGQVALDQAGGFDHGRQARVGGPEVPPLPVALGPADSGVVPELTQALLERPGPRRFQRGGLELGEPLPVLLRQILLGIQPEVLGPGQRRVPRRRQGAVFAFPHVVDGLSHVRHDVVAVEDHLGLGRGHVGADSLDVGLPHVQGDRLDADELVLRQPREVARQARLLAVLGEEFDGGPVQVADAGE